MKKYFGNKYILYSLFTMAGLFLGWLFFHPRHVGEKVTLESDQKISVWTCAMHPQIRMDKPGKCPICGMDLIPLEQNNTSIDADAIHFTEEAAQLANIQTSIVTKQNPVAEIRLYGKVEADERSLQSQVAYLSGRIEKLWVNFTGEMVRIGQPLALIYSPELITAQQELLVAARTKQTEPEIYEAAKVKLRQWKLTENQINEIENSGIVQSSFEIVSTTSGIVTTRQVNTGDYVSQGTVLFVVADLSKVWVKFDAYESDLTLLKKGDVLSFTVEALPGKNFSGQIAFIDPVLDPVTRVAKVRVEIANANGDLKPEMFVTGYVKADLPEYKDKLVIPGSAVLWTGKRSVVYIKLPGMNEPVFKLREIDLGPKLGNNYVVIDGLKEGEEIVTQGTFSVDAAAQLEGKPSMMNPGGGKTNTMPGMDMSGDDNTKNEKSIPKMKNNKTTLEQSATNMNDMIQHTTFNVSGNCDLCKARIEKAAKSVKGVKSAVWDTKSLKIHVEFDTMETSSEAIQKAIAQAGHDTEKIKADDETYSKLPECCKYR